MAKIKKMDKAISDAKLKLENTKIEIMILLRVEKEQKWMVDNLEAINESEQFD